MFYSLVRTVVALLLRLFYRVKVHAPQAETSGPVIFVGNHPNGLIDPALVFILTRRQVTFLAKEPLFQAHHMNLPLLDHHNLIKTLIRQHVFY